MKIEFYTYGYEHKGCYYSHSFKVSYNENDYQGATMEGYYNADNIFDVARILKSYKGHKKVAVEYLP